MCSPIVQKTEGGNWKKAKIDAIASLVKEEWMSIPREIIVKSYKKCGISNAVDDTEDDFIFKSEDKNSSDLETDFYDEETTRQVFIELFWKFR